MLIAHKAPDWFWRCGALLFAMQAYVFVFGQSIFQTGMWYTQEPRLLAMLLISALACGWVWHGLIKQWLSFPKRPPVYFMLILAWVGWQILVTLTSATSGWRSWFGTGMFGEGTAYYVCTALFAGIAYVLWPMAQYRKIMLGSVVSALLVMATLQYASGADTAWQVMNWPDYLAFLVGWVWVVILLGNPTMSIHRQLGGVIAAVCLIFVSMNKAAFILIIAAVMSLLVLRYMANREIKTIPLWVRRTACLMFALPLLYTFNTATPITGYDVSIEQRLQLNAVGVRAILDEPGRLLLGHGWNSFQDDLFKYAAFDNISTFKDGGFKVSSPLILGTAGHSHNQALEAVLALGIPGLLLWLTLGLYVIWAMPAAWFWRVIPIHMATLTLGFFWFNLSFFCAFMALYWAAMAHVLERRETTAAPATISPRNNALVAFLMPMLALTMLWSGWQQYRAIGYTNWLIAALRAPYEEYRMEAFLEDAKRGGERLRAITVDYLDRVRESEIPASAYRNQFPKGPPQPQLREDAYQWVERLLNVSHLLSANPHVGVHVGNLDMIISLFLQTRPDDARYNKAKAEAFLFYPASVMRTTAQVPRREDLAIPYLYYLEKKDDKETLSLVLTLLRDAYPEHRSAKWLTGKMLYQQPKTKEIGLKLMREALDARVYEIYPITDKERFNVIHESEVMLAQ